MKKLKLKEKKENKTFTASSSTMQPPSDKGTDKKNKKFIQALKYISHHDPDVFERVAPELLHRTLWELRGADPIFSEKVDYWIEKEHSWKDFSEILDNENKNDVQPHPNEFQLSNEDINVLQKLNERFYGDFHRWDTNKRHQFLLLGMIALHGNKGAKQGDLIDGLASNFSRTSVEGSNAIRASKVALSRLLKPYDLFAPAHGNGVNRIHKLESDHLSQLISRYVMDQKASILLPMGLEYEYDIGTLPYRHYVTNQHQMNAIKTAMNSYRLDSVGYGRGNAGFPMNKPWKTMKTEEKTTKKSKTSPMPATLSGCLKLAEQNVLRESQHCFWQCCTSPGISIAYALQTMTEREDSGFSIV